MMQRHVGDLLGNRRVVTLPPGATVRQAAVQMAAAHVASVVVTAGADDRLEGIFTERDLTARVVAGGLDPDTTPLAAVMTPCPIAVDRGTTVRDALRRMAGNRLRHLPVVEDGRVVGVLSVRDVVGEELARLDREKELADSLTEVI
ncbi:CBS domain-containing protein [Azospirillum sp. ST 5-10]|uniref:CBS domain-containing protein n=1 Tax=unclassified Azospirillum TaxID=2630922 RepID=UPI003F4A7F5D